MIAPPLLARWLATRFGLPSPTASLFRAYTNDVYLVETLTGRFVLKIYGAGWRHDAEIRWEIDLLRHLREREAPVVAPIAGDDGEALQAIDSDGIRRQAVLFEHAAGHKPQPPFSAAMYRRQGELAATVHRAADNFAARHGRVPLALACLLDWPLAMIEAFGIDGRVVGEISGIADRIRIAIAPLIDAGLDWGPCHGDLTFDNVHIADDGRTTLYDFDSGGPGWREIDLQGWAALVPGRADNWRAFLEGYRGIRPLADTDIAAAPLLDLALDIRGMHIELERRLPGCGPDAAATYMAGALGGLRRKASTIGLAD